VASDPQIFKINIISQGTKLASHKIPGSFSSMFSEYGIGNVSECGIE